MKCILCDQKKAKRFCPAKNGLICPECCGQKRVLEVDCPESCDYLRLGRVRESEDYAKLVRSLDPKEFLRARRLIMEQQDFLSHLEYVIGRERLSNRSLTDNNVVAAVTYLLQTYQTEDKGVLYESTSEDLRIEGLRRELKTIIETFRNPEAGEKGIVDPKAEAARLSLSVVIDCLEFMRVVANAYLKDRNSVSGYVDFLARLFPREEKRSSILMP